MNAIEILEGYRNCESVLQILALTPKMVDELRRLDAENAALKVKTAWNNGTPENHRAEEWFLAKLDNGGVVALQALQDGHSYDYTTADGTYFAKFRIKQWMQLPDSEYLTPAEFYEKQIGELRKERDELRAQLAQGGEPYGWAVFYDAHKDEEGVCYAPQWFVHIGADRPLNTYSPDVKFFPVYTAPQQAPVDSDVLAAANKLVLKAGYPSGTNLSDALYELAEQQAPATPADELEFALGALDWLERNAIREMFYPSLQQRATEALLIVRRELKARAALKPAVPEGYQLVPIEPTEAMIEASIDVDWGNDDVWEHANKQYKAMLAAAKDGES